MTDLRLTPEGTQWSSSSLSTDFFISLVVDEGRDVQDFEGPSFEITKTRSSDTGSL